MSELQSSLSPAGQGSRDAIEKLCERVGIVDPAGFALTLLAAAHESWIQFFKDYSETSSLEGNRIVKEALGDAWDRTWSMLDEFGIRPPRKWGHLQGPPSWALPRGLRKQSQATSLTSLSEASARLRHEVQIGRSADRLQVQRVPHSLRTPGHNTCIATMLGIRTVPS